MTAPPGNFSLLAACDRSENAEEGETSLCANVISILREAYETKKYVTFGGIHSNILARARTPGTVATMPIWQSNVNKTELDRSIWFLPLEKIIDPMISTGKVTAPSTLNADGGANDKDSKDLSDDSLLGCSVRLTALVKDWSEEGRHQFVEMFSDRMTTCEQAHMKLGDVEAFPMRTIKGTTLVGFNVDGRVYHELEEHDALFCIGGPYEPIY